MADDQAEAKQPAEAPMKIKQEVYPESWEPGKPAAKGDPDALIPVREETSPGVYRFVFRRRSTISPPEP